MLIDLDRFIRQDWSPVRWKWWRDGSARFCKDD